MATTRENLFDKLSGSYWNAGVTFQRTNPVPLEKYSVFQSYNDASAYALTNVVAYPGQTVAVIDEADTKLYYIDNNGYLSAFATGGNADEILRKLNQEIEDRKTSDTSLSTNLSVTVELCATAAGDNAATYIVKQGGEKVGVDINIPKDKVISSAYMVNVKGNYNEETPAVLTSFTVSWNETIETVTEESNPKAFAAIKQAYNGPEGGDGSYIRITVTNDEAAPIYIAVPQLVDTYEGGQTTEISVGVTGKKGETRLIYADLKAGSIAESKLCSDFTTKVANVIAAQAADRSAIEILSGDDIVDGSVKKALKDAKAYTDEVSAALSTDYVAKVAAVEAEVAAEVAARDTAISNAISTLNYSDSVVANKFVTAVSETDGIISVTRAQPTSADISDLAQTLTDAKTEAENVVIGTAEDLSTASTVYGAKAYADAVATNKVDSLNFAELTASQSQTLKMVRQDNGLISAEVQDIKIDISAVTLLQDNLNGISSNLTGEVEGSVNKRIEAAKTDLSGTEANTSADITIYGARKYAEQIAEEKALSVKVEIDGKIEGLDLDRVNVGSTKTLEFIEQVDGQVSATAVDIQIAQSQVDNLTSDLSAIRYNLSDDAEGLVDGTVNNRIKTAKEAAIAVTEQLSGEVSAISANHEGRITANERAIELLSSAVHFRGVLLSSEIPTSALTSELSVEEGLVDKFKPCYKGDFALYVTDGTEYIYSPEVSTDTAVASAWVKIGDEGTYVKKSEYYAKVAELEAADSYISGAVDNKVKVGTGVWDETSATYSLENKTSLSVVKISDEDYYKLVAAGKQNDDVLYIVSSDYVNGHGQRVINVGTPVEDTDAVNLSTLALSVSNIEQECADKEVLSVKINDVLFDFSKADNIAVLSIDYINCGGAD